MKVLIAEKPSVAQSIAAIVGANSRKDGYLEGNGYAVTWAFGHLVGLAMPQDYGITGFQAENLILCGYQSFWGKTPADTPVRI